MQWTEAENSGGGESQLEGNDDDCPLSIQEIFFLPSGVCSETSWSQS